MRDKSVELTQKHLDAMSKFGTGTPILDDDLIRFADPEWDGTHSADTGRFPSSPKWLEFRAYIRKQPGGAIAGHRLVVARRNDRSSGVRTGTWYMYVK